MLYFDSDSAWWQIWGMGDLLTNNLFMVFTVGGEDSCCLWVECVDCAAFAGNKTLWISSGYPHPHSWSLCNSLTMCFVLETLAQRVPFLLAHAAHPSQHPGECRLTSWCSLMDVMGTVAVKTGATAEGLALFILPSLTLPELSDLRKSWLQFVIEFNDDCYLCSSPRVLLLA